MNDTTSTASNGTGTATPTIRDMAPVYQAGHIALIPCSSKDKRPDMALLPRDPETGKPTWNPLAEHPADTATVQSWFDRDCKTLAAATGKASEGILAIDFDDPSKYEPWCKEVGELADGLPVQRTGREGGGYQVWLRCPTPGPNAKLAWVPDEKEETGRRIAIETRGDGGYAILPGSLHPSGRCYEAIAGDWTNIPMVSQARADALLTAAKKLDEAPLTKQEMERIAANAKPSDKYRSGANGETSVIDLFNQKCTIEAALAQYGYKQSGEKWVRPGGKTASVMVKEGRSLHFSSNDPLSDHHWHTPFDFYCHYGHNGDCKAAVKAVAERLGVSHQGKTAKQQVAPQAEPGPWPEITPFDALDLPEFPFDSLPASLGLWVAAESYATQTPPDLAALLALASCSSCLARRVVVQPRPGWQEPVNLFVAVLLEPGNRKSAVFTDTIRPLKEYEAELIEAARPTVAKLQSQRRREETRLRKLEKQAAEIGDTQTHQEADRLAAELAEQPEAVLPRLMIDDATSEKLGMMLSEQGGRIASVSPEGGVFDLMKGLYSKSGIAQFGVYLMGHSGDDLVTDRVTRKAVRVERPALTCAYAMQPQVIAGLADNAAFRGRGLLARFLYAAPKSWIGERKIATDPVPVEVTEGYRQTVRSLAAVQGEHVLRLADDAAEELKKWEAEIEAMLADGGDMEVLRDWGAKLAGATLRVAAVLHCSGSGNIGSALQTFDCGNIGVERSKTDYLPPISIATLQAAIAIARYLIPHTQAVLALMQAQEATAEADAQYVLAWIERHHRTEFTKRDVQQHGKRRFPKADDIDPALTELAARGYIRPKSAPNIPENGPGRPPSPAFEVNPALYTSQKRSQYSHNSSQQGVTP
jgi:hypothetical protein